MGQAFTYEVKGSYRILSNTNYNILISSKVKGLKKVIAIKTIEL
ncbi:conserved hypothetical protein [Clostridium botulinum Bf]|uniref:Uncharacterized protein n=1 Tax=Clostridium botulinum (strain 657 / Type Ba4) TaxID=515621 RepID=A0A3F2ZZM1_CLOB6|nr:hypothetical protein CLJ_B2377 [Clostridium botulinum Ba4 str. 657]EDT84987.1 conserved hypothetical protein [Clostridium botulinum Bf]